MLSRSDRHVAKQFDSLLKFDLTGNNNKSLKTAQNGGRAKIVKGALFDTTSLNSIAASNHTCAVSMTGYNHNDSFEDTIRKVKSRRQNVLFILILLLDAIYSFNCCNCSHFTCPNISNHRSMLLTQVTLPKFATNLSWQSIM